VTLVNIHPDEFPVDAALVQALLSVQFPHWASLPIEPVRSTGTDNAIFRLGDALAVRLPRRASAAAGVEKEQTWLPRIAHHLPLAAPRLLGRGKPGCGYPFNWSVCSWLGGESAMHGQLKGCTQAADDLASYIRVLHGLDTSGGPAPGEHNFWRGVPLAARDEYARTSIDALRGLLDVGLITAAWELALRVPAWSGPLVWIHGDIQASNLLVRDGRLTAVIDFGGLAVGDPACDLMVAWSMFSGEQRETFRTAVSVDDATWARGRGWALSQAVVALPYYLQSSAQIAGASLRTIAEVLSESPLD